MKLRPCAREKELIGQVESGYWPEACSLELHAHIDVCQSCRDLVRVMQAMREARAAAAGAARLEPPGVLWWKAQLRRRRAVMQTIERPMIVAQVFAVVFALAAAAFLLAQGATPDLGWLRWLKDLPAALGWNTLLPAVQANPGAGLLAAAAVLAVVACGAAAYAGLEKR